jgi:hypothetical protein
MKMRKTLLLCLLGGLCLGSDDCGSIQEKNREDQMNKASKAASQVRFNENAEIDNIKARLELTSSPGLLGYVALINKVGQVVYYTPVKGKITSGGKRLTQPTMYTGSQYTEAPSDEGTWGHSNPYIYFWTPGGQYIQTSLEYVYSDKPFRMSEKPLLISETESVK